MTENDKILINAYLDGEISIKDSSYVEDLIESDSRALNYCNALKSANTEVNNFYQKDRAEIENNINLFIKSISGESISNKNIFQYTTFFKGGFLSYALTAILFVNLGFGINYFSYNNKSNSYSLPGIADFYDKNIELEFAKVRSIKDSEIEPDIILESIDEMIKEKSLTAIITHGTNMYRIKINDKIINNNNVVCFNAYVFTS